MPSTDTSLPTQPRKRRVTETDQKRAAEYVYDHLSSRANSTWRKDSEVIWKDVDRQISMQPTTRGHRSGDPDEDWHNAFQLGHLADAQEILADDIVRMIVPNKKWFNAHVELLASLDGQIEPGRQREADQTIRSFMNMQMMDFGFEDQLKLSIKESLAHGAVACEVEMTTQAKYHYGYQIEHLTAPQLKPRSMWNSFPDPSPTIDQSGLFYGGSMIFKEFVHYDHLKYKRGWRNLDKINKPKSKTNDLDVVIFYGPMHLERNDSDGVFLPNRKWIFVDQVMVYTEVNSTPYSPIIYFGLERDDPRNPYFSSQLIKRAPTAKVASQLTNDYLDGVELKNQPPMVYEKTDSHLAANGGPKIAPGAASPASGLAGVKVLETGDPTYARQGALDASAEVERGLGIDATRSGVSAAVERTATEVVKAEQRAGGRTASAAGMIERQCLRPWLYMSHALNLDGLVGYYPVYNEYVGVPDLVRVSKRDLPKNVHFTVSGSKSMLAEEAKSQQFYAALHAGAQIAQISERLNWDAITEELFAQPNLKDPERFLLAHSGDDLLQTRIVAAVQQVESEATEAIQQMQGQLGQMQEALQQAQVKGQKLELELATAQSQARIKDEDVNALQEVARVQKAREQAEDQLRQIQGKIEKQTQSLVKLQLQMERSPSDLVRETA